MGGPLMGLNRSPMLRTTVLKTLNRAASLGSDTEGGGMSSSRVSPHATWFRSCRWRKADYITTVLKVIFGHFITVMYATTITKAIQMAQCRQSRVLHWSGLRGYLARKKPLLEERRRKAMLKVGERAPGQTLSLLGECHAVGPDENWTPEHDVVIMLKQLCSPVKGKRNGNNAMPDYRVKRRGGSLMLDTKTLQMDFLGLIFNFLNYIAV